MNVRQGASFGVCSLYIYPFGFVKKPQYICTREYKILYFISMPVALSPTSTLTECSVLSAERRFSSPNLDKIHCNCHNLKMCFVFLSSLTFSVSQTHNGLHVEAVYSPSHHRADSVEVGVKAHHFSLCRFSVCVVHRVFKSGLAIVVLMD